jgi:N-acyl-L-homoserine lactone synthetase
MSQEIILNLMSTAILTLPASNLKVKSLRGTAQLTPCFEFRYQIFEEENGYFKDLDETLRQLKLERDPYDKHARHFAALTPDGQTIAYARLIMPSALGLPTTNAFDVEYQECVGERVAEISRLSIAKQWRSGYVGNWLKHHLYRHISETARLENIDGYCYTTQKTIAKHLAQSGIPLFDLNFKNKFSDHDRDEAFNRFAQNKQIAVLGMKTTDFENYVQQKNDFYLLHQQLPEATHPQILAK